LDKLEQELMGGGISGSVVGGSSPFFGMRVDSEKYNDEENDKIVDDSDMEDVKDMVGDDVIKGKLDSTNSSSKKWTLCHKVRKNSCWKCVTT
jgi:hypothetical protein